MHLDIFEGGNSWGGGMGEQEVKGHALKSPVDFLKLLNAIWRLLVELPK